MITPFIVIFAGFLEIILVLSIFWGTSHQLTLRKKKSIIVGGCLGIGISLLVPIAFSAFPKKSIETAIGINNLFLKEGLVFTSLGIIVFLVTSTLHKYVNAAKKASKESNYESFSFFEFDLLFFFTIVCLIMKEGFEIGYFSQIQTDIENILKAFMLAISIGGAILFMYHKCNPEKVFVFNKYALLSVGMIVFLNGLGLVENTLFFWK